MPVRPRDLPAEFRSRLIEERRQAKQAADAFVRFCKEDRADLLSDAAHWLHECSDEAWRLAMTKVARLQNVSADVQSAFLNIWIETKMLPLTVGNRRVMADALHVLMPCNYSGPPLTLCRGTSARERCHRRYGFSWTTDLTIARTFAERWAQPVPDSPELFEGVIFVNLSLAGSNSAGAAAGRLLRRGRGRGGSVPPRKDQGR
jgi:hypothetical protein